MKKRPPASLGPGRQRAWSRRYDRGRTAQEAPESAGADGRKPVISLIPDDVLELIRDQLVTRTGWAVSNLAGKATDHDPAITLQEACGLIEPPLAGAATHAHIWLQDGTTLAIGKKALLRCWLSDGGEYVPLEERERRGTPRHQLTFWNYGRWAEILARGVDRFQAANGFSPNVMLASHEVYDRIDRLAQSDRESVQNEQGESPAENQYIELGGFSCRGAELTFAVDESIRAPHYVLVYDGNAEFVSEEEFNAEADNADA